VRNLGPIYKVKKADAERAEAELAELTIKNNARITDLEKQLASSELEKGSTIGNLVQTKLDGPAARMEALDRLTATSPAMWWAHIFIIILFLMIEATPILVKLMSKKGPYDSLLHTVEHEFICKEVESVATISAETKGRTAALRGSEQNYVVRKLDAELS